MPLFKRPTCHSDTAPILELEQVTVRYDGRVALEDISLRMERGERLAVVGPNGAGKSTLFKVIAGVLPPTSGQVLVAGESPGRHICIAYVPQRSEVDWAFPVTVADVVMMGRFGRLGLLRRPGRRDREHVHRCLEAVGLSDLAHRQVGELSGGQQQRMFLARALAQEAEIVLMDEPLTGLDAPAREEILHLFEDLTLRQVTLLVATHELALAGEQFERVALLNRRLLGLGRPAEVLIPEHLRAAYGSHLRLFQTDEGLIALGDTCCEGGEG